MSDSTTKDGGPAFPIAKGIETRDGTIRKTEMNEGMSLRDYFAAKAMQSMTAGPGARMVADRDGRYDETNWAEVVALNAYEMADAMLKARQS